MSFWERTLHIVSRPPLAVGIAACALVLWGGVLLRADSVGMPQPAVAMTREYSATPQVQGASTVNASPDCAHTACLALTFDDGPVPAITPQILDILARHHTHATFFLVGVHVPHNQELVRRMYDEGHEIGNHSWTHPDLTKLPFNEVEDQVSLAQAAILDAGVPAPQLFRPPYGATNPAVRSHIPLPVVMWDVDPEDWRQTDPQKIIASVEAAAGPGKIIDLHDLHQPTVDALDQLLTDLQPTYQLVTVSQLLRPAPGQMGPFYGR